MTITIQWADTARSIIHYNFNGKWTWAEFYDATAQAEQMAKAVKRRVDFLVDMRQTGRPPANPLTHLRHITPADLPNAGLTVVIADNSLVRSLYDILGRVNEDLGERLRIVDTEGEAKTMIARSRRAEQRAEH